MTGKEFETLIYDGLKDLTDGKTFKITREAAKSMASYILEAMKEDLTENEKTSLFGLGTFRHSKRKYKITTPSGKVAEGESTTISFKPSKAIKELLNK